MSVGCGHLFTQTLESMSTITDSEDQNEISPVLLKLRQLSVRLTPKQLVNYLIHGYIRFSDDIGNHSQSIPIAIIHVIVKRHGPLLGWMTMLSKEVAKLKVGDNLDHRDDVGRFVVATVVEKQGSKLKIHYNGWSGKWDTWSDFKKEWYRFAVAGSIYNRIAHGLTKLKKGSFIDVNPIWRHPGWKHAQIKRLITNQIQVVYRYGGLNYLYWTHVDNPAEVAEFTSMAMRDQTQTFN